MNFLLISIFMHVYGNFFEANWVQTYKYTDQTWLVDSLNWEKISTPALLDTGVLSFLQNSSFLNQHLTVDFSTKISYLDIILLNSANFTNSVLVLYNSYIYDLYNLFSFTALPVLTLFFSSYQDVYGVTLLVSPEVIMAHLDYFT